MTDRERAEQKLLLRDLVGAHNGAGPMENCEDCLRRIEIFTSAVRAEARQEERQRKGVRIGCVSCGREIWEDAADWTTLGQARRAECSDCAVAKILAERAAIEAGEDAKP